MIGKTVSGIEEAPTDHGRQQHGTLLIRFTDGTALEIVGSSYEEVDLSWQEIDAKRLRRYEQAAAGRREAERVARLRRAEWDALSPEERAERERVRRSKMSPFALAMEDSMRGMARSMVSDLNRAAFVGHIPIIGTENLSVKPRARKS